MQEFIQNNPWPYAAIPNFLSPERFKEIQRLGIEELKNVDRVGYFSVFNQYHRYLREDLLPEVNVELFNALPTDVRDRKYKNLKKLVHWNVQPEGGKWPLHIDAEWRMMTAILYIAPEQNSGTFIHENDSPFVPNHGGGSWGDSQQGHAIRPSTNITQVEWQPNTLFVHKPINGVSWHHYESMANQGPRISLAVFFVDPDIMPLGMKHNTKNKDSQCEFKSHFFIDVD